METNRMITREMKEEDLHAGIELRNRIFAPIRLEDWGRGEPKTAITAWEEEALLGFIPLYFRRMRLSEDVEVTTAFENAVGVSEACRGKGVGGRMIEEAARFLKGRAQALLVYRGGEDSQGYRFYQKTGHSDLLYTRVHWISAHSGALPAGVREEQGAQAVLDKAQALCGIFNDCYRGRGGFIPRDAVYWPQALATSYLSAHPVELTLLYLESGSKPTAYLLAARRTRAQDADLDLLHLLDFAARGGDCAQMRVLLEAARSLASGMGLRGVTVQCSTQALFGGLLEEAGFQARARDLVTMARSFDPQTLFARAWEPRLAQGGAALAEAGIRVCTPERDCTLREAAQGARSITLEMKEPDFTRLLMGRLSLEERVREGSVTYMGDTALLQALCAAVPLTPWEYFDIDYI